MIKIYSKPGCAQCVSAAALCQARGIEHKVLKLDDDYRLEDVQALTGQRTMAMPVVVLPDHSVTGYAGLISHLKR